MPISSASNKLTDSCRRIIPQIILRKKRAAQVGGGGEGNVQFLNAPRRDQFICGTKTVSQKKAVVNNQQLWKRNITVFLKHLKCFHIIVQMYLDVLTLERF